MAAMLFTEAPRPGPVNGSAKLRCAVAEDGRVEHCVVLSESPPGAGFGARALEVSKKFRMNPKPGQKTLRRGVVNIPVTFVAERAEVGVPKP